MSEGHLLLSPLLAQRGIPHGFGTRLTPPEAFPSPLYTLAQVHGDRVVALAEPLPLTTFRHAEADALVTGLAGVFLGIRTADCLPVLLVDPSSGVVGAAHCGWRSLAMGILGKAVGEMARLGAGAEAGKGFSPPAGFLAALGPCIRSCCYEVGEEVREAFSGHPGSAAAFCREGGRLTFDLSGAARAELLGLGLAQGNIDTRDLGCTRCRPGLFHSWRGERTRERMTSWIGSP